MEGLQDIKTFLTCVDYRKFIKPIFEFHVEYVDVLYFQSCFANAELFPDKVNKTDHSIQRTSGDWFTVENKCLWIQQGIV